MIRLLAALMALTHAASWFLVHRWERPGKGAEHRVRIHAPRLVRLGGNVALYASLLYPVLVVISPRWTYEGGANWSSSIDVALLVGGLLLWTLGVAVLLWASWVMGWHLAIEGVGANHELVTHGPYRYLRHPVYVSFAAIAIGTALIFRSYILLGLSVVLTIAGRWWANAEERVLASSGGFGDVYRIYAVRTARFFPRLRRSGSSDGQNRS